MLIRSYIQLRPLVCLVSASTQVSVGSFLVSFLPAYLLPPMPFGKFFLAMPSFFSKVGHAFSKKRSEQSGTSKTRASVASSGSLLDGQRFENVSKPQSPSVANFLETAQERHTPKDKGKAKEQPKLSFLRPKSPPLPATEKPSKDKDIPSLALSLPEPSTENKDTPSLDAIFEMGGKDLMDWDTLGAKRLTPEDALALIGPCANAIKTRGTRQFM
jgi:hypothetical protein